MLPGSSELNPLLKGYHRRSAKFPTWPWAWGTTTQPKGFLCKVCVVTFEMAGFKENPATPTSDKFVSEMKVSKTLCDEFQACAKEFIWKVNHGSIAMRVRGQKKTTVIEGFRDTRRKVVELVKTTGTNVSEKFRAVSLVKWQEKHGKRDPRDDGHVVKFIEIPSQGRVECVLVRSLPEGEWDVELNLSLAAIFREDVDDGSSRLRANQEEAKHASLADQVGSAFSHNGAQPKYLQAALPACTGAAQPGPQEAATVVDADDSSDASEEEDDPLHGAFPSLQMIIHSATSVPAGAIWRRSFVRIQPHRLMVYGTWYTVYTVYGIR